MRPTNPAETPKHDFACTQAWGARILAVVTNDGGVDAAIVSRYFEQCLADTEGDVDDDEVRMVREALAAKAVIPLLDPAAYLRRTERGRSDT